MNILVLILFALGAGYGTLSPAGKSTEGDAVRARTSGLRNPVAPAEKDAHTLHERKQMIDHLMATIEDPENHTYPQSEKVDEALMTLGSMRADEAIDVLIKYIGFSSSNAPLKVGPYLVGIRPRRRSESFERRYPAVGALIAIGEPCIPKVIAKLAETGHVVEQEACMAVLRRLNALSQAREALEEALKDAPERRRFNLERLLDKVTEAEREPVK